MILNFHVLVVACIYIQLGFQSPPLQFIGRKVAEYTFISHLTGWTDLPMSFANNHA